MKSLPVLLGMLCALTVAAPAAAEHDEGRRDSRWEQRDDARRGGADEWRDGRGGGRDRTAERGQRRESLSPDERRQLRRDIEDYGRDIYRDGRGNGRGNGRGRGRN